MNDDSIHIPDVILAFTPAPELRELTIERRNVQNIVNRSGCNAHAIDGFSVDFLMDYKAGAKDRKMRLLVFHYGGHASVEGLAYITERNGVEEACIMSYEDLNQLADLFSNLRFVFINACNTQPASELFFEKVEAIIYTTKSIHDEIASLFACTFYANFFKVQDLNTAFDDTITQVFKLSRNGISLLSKKRDTISQQDLDEADPSVFGIKYRDDKFKTSTFQSWVQSIQPMSQSKKDPTTTQNKGPQPNAYLLCDRTDMHQSLIQNELRDKRDMPQPLFIFIHGTSDDCPSDFRDRFAIHTLPKELGIKTPIEIELPSPQYSALDKCKLILRENYCYKSGFGKKNDVDKTWSFVSRKPNNDNEFILIHHNLIGDKWATTWQDFFDYYLNEFSKELMNFSDKLIIVVTRTAQPDGFTDYFNGLTSNPDRQIVNLSAFDKIEYQHIEEWQETVFGRNQFKSETIVAVGDDKFFKEIIPLLQAKLPS